MWIEHQKGSELPVDTGYTSPREVEFVFKNLKRNCATGPNGSPEEYCQAIVGNAAGLQ